MLRRTGLSLLPVLASLVVVAAASGACPEQGDQYGVRAPATVRAGFPVVVTIQPAGVVQGGTVELDVTSLDGSTVRDERRFVGLAYSRGLATPAIDAAGVKRTTRLAWRIFDHAGTELCRGTVTATTIGASRANTEKRRFRPRLEGLVLTRLDFEKNPSCWGSPVSSEPTAARCFIPRDLPSGANLLDPCYEVEWDDLDWESRLVCIDAPWSRSGYTFSISGRMEYRNPRVDWRRPYAIQLDDGDRCTMQGGAGAVGKYGRVDYYCESGRYLFPVNTHSAFWRVRAARLVGSRGVATGRILKVMVAWA